MLSNMVSQEPSMLLKNIKDQNKIGGTATKLQSMSSGKELNTNYANVSKSVEKPMTGNKLQ
jgi:hypothetical protein